jgi:hypothetical protein
MNVEGYSVTSSKTWKKKDEDVREVEWKRMGGGGGGGGEGEGGGGGGTLLRHEDEVTIFTKSSKPRRTPRSSLSPYKR